MMPRWNHDGADCVTEDGRKANSQDEPYGHRLGYWTRRSIADCVKPSVSNS